MLYRVLKDMSVDNMYNYCVEYGISADDIFALSEDVEDKKYNLQHEYDELFQSGRYDYSDNSVNYSKSTLNRMEEIEDEIEDIKSFLNNSECCYEMLVYGV